ncbi:glycine--tRNA ligase [Halopenitus sp. H-Gu1]|uniref:glycine--tRNA ligase n=1 Tax=Halopenitus sp. H-Gu1 TaxID=3242697 RepID=UPI00359D5856
MAGSDLIELAKRRGFFFGSNGAYGGTAGFYTFGPRGAALKRNLEDAWRDRFTLKEDNHEIEAPTVMPEAVFEASGHLEGFDDMLVECGECGASHRADHLVEDATPIEDAETLSGSEIESLIHEHDIACPACGTPLAGQDVEDFNLMFATNIGPGDSKPGYLRPETAQGIFVEFPRLKEYARGQLPFGVTQIGPAYRNEISPRGGLLRLREFTQAELEQFIDPEDDAPPLERVSDVEVRLYPATEQETDGETYLDVTIGEAVAEGIIGSAWVGYYLGVAREWYERIGVDMGRFRFRQHLPGERAHYAADCWDAESEIDGDWIEIAGFAYRGDYDLSKHGEYADDTFTVFKRYDEPRTVERATVDPDMSILGPEFGGQAKAVGEALERLAERDPDAFDDDTVTLDLEDGETVTVDVDVANFSIEETTETGEHITPHVVEPSFGVGRTVQTLLSHAYTEDEVDGEERTYLDLVPEVAPVDVAVFPLVSNDERLVDLADRVAADLRDRGSAVSYDDSGSIGRRYRRQDEIGTPFCVTVDRDGIEGEGPESVTVRERDEARQARVPVTDLAEEIDALLGGDDTTFDDLLERHDSVETDVETA